MADTPKDPPSKTPTSEVRVSQAKIMEMTTDIVRAYLSNTELAPAEISTVLEQVHATLTRLAQEEIDRSRAPAPKPAVPIAESLREDVLICLEDGLAFQSLKRHLRVKYNLSPEAYREKWGLPRDYPMVAPNYAKRRSELAKKTGLGKSVPRKGH